MTDTDGADPRLGAPELHPISSDMIGTALAAGWRDFRAAPQYGLFFGAFYVVIGLLIWQVTRMTGQTYWILLAAFGFPLIGPFAAVGTYEVSRRLEAGEPLTWPAILGVVWREKDRQIPSLAAIMIVLFIFWVVIGHILFALFLGLTPMTNIYSSFEVFMSANGLMLLVAEFLVGGVFAFVIYAITVIGMPMLVDREVDFVTAMITSFSVVTSNPGPMLQWGAMVVALLVLGMIPFFLGLLVILPVLGHATWRLYRAAVH